jgi:hypothetical protein
MKRIKMNTGLIIVGSIMVLLTSSQVYTAVTSRKTEMYAYKVVKDYNTFEIRKYEEAVFAKTSVNAKGYSEGANNGFRILAGYIFGGNEKNESISMTSPVKMTMDEKMTMEFMMPSVYNINTLPKPNDNTIEFYTKPAVLIAAIRFDGFYSESKFEKYKNILLEELAKNKITHNNQFQFLGYNPPYQLVDRRNEIIVEVEY